MRLLFERRSKLTAWIYCLKHWGSWCWHRGQGFAWVLSETKPQHFLRCREGMWSRCRSPETNGKLFCMSDALDPLACVTYIARNGLEPKLFSSHQVTGLRNSSPQHFRSWNNEEDEWKVNINLMLGWSSNFLEHINEIKMEMSDEL